MAKFNEEICQELCELCEEGLTAKSCAAIVGIGRRTLYDWLERGKNAKSGKYRTFYLNWKKAEARYEQYHLGKIHNSKSWMAHQYLLQVKDSETYVVAEKQQVESKAEVDLKADADVSIESVFDIVDKELELDTSKDKD